MSDSFVKLALAGETSTKGYLLLKISQPYGVSIEDIKHEASVLYCDTTGTSRADLDSQGYTVTLEFRDHEGDSIIVKTDLDLRNFSAALPLSYCGKVFANVSTTSSKGSTGVQTASASVTTQTEQKVEDKNQDNQKIVDAIADIFSIAAVSMKAGITAAMTKKTLALDTAKEAVNKKETRAANEVSMESLKAAKRLTKERYKMLHHALKQRAAATHDFWAEPTQEQCAMFHAAGKKGYDKGTAGNDTKVKEESVKKEKISESTSAPPPFIHGRHTCDQCLTTPIIGSRFHASNLPDYDLCANCHGNYKGTEISFEEAQLERDAPFQERWNRKRAMNEGHLKIRTIRQSMSRSHCRRGCSRSSDKAVSFEGPKAEPTTISSEPSSSPVVPTINGSNGLDDLALEEAIRRSLNDVSNDSTKNDDKVQPENLVVDNVVGTESSLVEPDLDVVMEEARTVVEEPEIVVSEELPPGKATSLANETSFATQAVGSGEVAEFVGETLDRMSEAINDLNIGTIDKGDLIYESNFVEHFTESEYDSDDDSYSPKIVDGEEDADSTSSWSVVVEKEDEIIEDGGLGRAAEALGSALFQSDMMRSVEGTSAAVSSVTTVPTVAPSIVMAEPSASTIQFQRWSAQLEQLHELGFMDDAANIDTLELLSAANIGVDSDEEVTVQQVVQKLMGD